MSTPPPMPPLRRVRVVPVDAFLFAQFFSGHPASILESDWPSDGRVVDAQWGFNRMRLELLVQSATFDEVPENAIPPEWSPTFKVHWLAPELVEMLEREQRERELDDAVTKA